MSVQTLGIEELPDSATELGAAPPNAAPQALRTLAVAAVCLGVAALAAATFVLSYSAIRTVALQAGITPRLARGYPLLLDAMLVIVLAAILALRGAGLPSKLLAWVTLLLVMTVAAGADALHTAGRSMPHQAAAITAAVLPFVLVLVAFVLLLVMLRHARLKRLATIADPAPVDGSGWGPTQRAFASAGFEHGLGAPTPRDERPEPAVDADAAAGDDLGTNGGSGEPATGTTPYPVDALAPGWYDDEAGVEHEYSGLGLAAEAPDVADSANTDPDDDDGPVFHRLFSAPTPLDVEMTEDQATGAEQADLRATELEKAEADPTETETTQV